MGTKDGKEIFQLGANAFIPVVANVRVSIRIICNDVDEFQKICYACRGKKLDKLPPEVTVVGIQWEDDDWEFRNYIKSRFEDVGEVVVSQDEINEIVKQFEDKDEKGVN